MMMAKMINKRIKEILEQQKEAVGIVLRASQKITLVSNKVDIDDLEALLKIRAEQMTLIEHLEQERQTLMDESAVEDEAIQRLRNEIQENLFMLAGIDDHIENMVFRAKLRLTNSMAFSPKLVNLGENAAEGYHMPRRVVDIMR
jgi:predicted GTPase